MAQQKSHASGECAASNKVNEGTCQNNNMSYYNDTKYKDKSGFGCTGSSC